ncbi:hypothetical protein ACIF85_41920 [Streptomyces sp. NPDC086033]|uniref:hypothetical protein n=1 Tax=Streptomyces sp. NPDC086033 TaxID=3365747 RepID=UPI0037CEF539
MAGTILRGRGSGVRDVGVHLNAGDHALGAVPAGRTPQLIVQSPTATTSRARPCSA